MLSVLRYDLGLTGSKFGCGEGYCGACTVLVDGQPARSCVIDWPRRAGKAVTTIEAIADGGRLHPVQEAFLEAEAFQCGYCTPGMVIAAIGLLDSTRIRPSRTSPKSSIATSAGAAPIRGLSACGSRPREKMRARRGESA